jgi:hypothetical protein
MAIQVKQRDRKKEAIALRLLLDEYPTIDFGVMNPDRMPIMILPNGPHTVLLFLSIDNWNTIKRKITKLISSKGCVICFETKKELSPCCQLCCDTYCMDCLQKIKICSICRQSFDSYLEIH